MTLAGGTKLGPYEILASVGAGGMGEVYRARDERLKRDVAIKVLPATYSSDTERLRRFEQEAQAAGALNHPNITGVYDIGQHDGAPYIVQELLEGETLRSRLASGAFTPRRAIGHALQIAAGLGAAHTKGIVHRDLKPENIFVTSDGRVKILDFGLAKLTQPEGVGSSATSLPTAAPGTEPGLVMGTVGYMSPEQVRGKFIDARSDIFSFGTILYEMLSGKRAFLGDTTADTMSAILTKEPPDLSETNRRVPESLERIVRHCLEKSPEARFQSASDIAFDLDALAGAPLTSGALPAARRPRRLLVPAAILLALLGGALFSRFLWRAPTPSPPSFRRLTFRRGNLASVRFTPDGNSIVYGASWDGRPIEVFTARLGKDSTPLGLLNADLLSISPSGELAVSIRDKWLTSPAGNGTLARVPISGGPPRQIMQFVDYADWASDGKSLAITRPDKGQHLLEFPIGTTLYKTSKSLASPRFSPKGNRIAVLETTPQGVTVLVLSLDGAVQRIAENLTTNRLAWEPRGEEIWCDEYTGGGQSTISAFRLDGRKRVVARVPAQLGLMDIAPDGRVLLERSTVASGVLFRGSAMPAERDLGWLDFSFPMALSDGGEWLLLQVFGDAVGPGGSFYMRRTDGSAPVKLGDGTAFDLSPDGKFVLALTDPKGGLSLVPTGPGAPVAIERGGLRRIEGGAILPNGKGFVVIGREAEQSPRLLYVQESPTSKPRPLSQLKTSYVCARSSPDGGAVLSAYEVNENLSIVSIDGSGKRDVPNTKGLEPIVWDPNGASFFAFESGSTPLRILKIDATTGQRALWGDLAPADMTGLIWLGGPWPVMTPDGKSYAYGYQRSASSDLFLVEGLK